MKKVEMEKHKNKSISVKKGFSLVEVLFSVMVLSVGVSAVAVLMTSNIKNSITAKNQVIASMLAQEGIELVRNLKDSNPTLFTAEISDGTDYRIDYNYTYDIFKGDKLASTSKQLFISPTGFYLHSSVNATATKFYRKIAVTITSDANSKKTAEISSFVSWNGADIPGVCNVANKCTSIVSVLPDMD